MINQLGFGAYKFQTIISNEMKQTSTNKTIKVEQRKSVQEKCKLQFQNAKQKIIQKLQDPQEKERLQTLAHIESDHESPNIVEYKKKKDKEFVLEVSESSSDTNTESSKENSQLIEEENTIAGQNLKCLTTPAIIRSPQVSQSRAQVAKQKVKAMKISKYPIIRKEIEFLKSLCQNQNFVNSDTAILDEYKMDREICVDMDCQDIVTFMRLQHEVEEMRRKQIEFTTQKERHYEVKQHTKIKKQEDTNNKFWTVMMAKRFIKNMKLKKEQSPPKSMLRKSSRGSSLNLFLNR